MICAFCAHFSTEQTDDTFKTKEKRAIYSNRKRSPSVLAVAVLYDCINKTKIGEQIEKQRGGRIAKIVKKINAKKKKVA